MKYKILTFQKSDSNNMGVTGGDDSGEVDFVHAPTPTGGPNSYIDDLGGGPGHIYRGRGDCGGR